jgi:solute:Na+ symporter, SSS family
VFLLMMFFGVMGMIAYANDPEAFDNNEKYSYLAFFYLLEPLHQGWQILTLVLVTSLAASSVDTLQNGLSSIFSRDLVKIGWHPQWFVRLFMVLINIPAIYLASEQYDVISLFLVADLVCTTSVFPVFCGLQTKDKGILKAPTELGAFLGCVSGIIAVLVNGAINNVKGGVFEYFWLRNGGICSLCGTETMVSFIVTPLVSLAMTYVFSYMDILARGERARRPLIPVAFDADDDDSIDALEATCDKDNIENVKEASVIDINEDVEGEGDVNAMDQSLASACGSIKSLKKLRVKSTFLHIGVDFLPSEPDRGNSREGKADATTILLFNYVVA